ncbi:MAG TPA: hypothetical protein DEF47_23425 [Herpetosiphon sp.]|nr:hypothetical protein [Herpetosiphon sp.]
MWLQLPLFFDIDFFQSLCYAAATANSCTLATKGLAHFYQISIENFQSIHQPDGFSFGFYIENFQFTVYRGL